MAKKDKSKARPRLRFPEFIEQPLRGVLLNDVTAESAIRNGDRLPPTSVMGVTKAEGIVPMEERIIAADIARYKIVQKNWFAYNPMRLNIGSIARWQGDADILVSPDYVVFQCLDDPDFGVDPAYLDHFRQSIAWNALVSEGGDGGVRVRIYYKDLARLRMALPHRAEQQKIADCLTSLDELIAAQERKVEALKAHKRGLMQELFPREGETIPRLRFPEFRDGPEWEEKQLRKVATYENGKAYEQDIIEQGKYIVVNSRFISTDGAIQKYSNAEFCISAADDVLMVLSDLPEGRALAKCFFVDADNRYAVNQRVCQLTNLKSNGRFLYYSLNRHPYLLAFDDGLGQTHLRKEAVLDCPLWIPPTQEEQKAVADCLTSLDALIAAESKKIDALKTHKKGLMQQLFPAPEGD